MNLRYLLGPVSASRASSWQPFRDRGECLCFGPDGSSDLIVRPEDRWEDLLGRLPTGFAPDFVLLDLGYVSVPRCLWHSPIPLVAWAIDWQLQWHFLRQAAPRCAAIFTDVSGVEVFKKAGLTQARPLNLFGLQGIFTQPRNAPPPRRDLDVLFVGNLNPAVQGERLPWLARLADLASRYRVAIVSGVQGEAYRQLLYRAKIVFNRSLKGEWNLRVGEATSSGALLFQESSNREMMPHWQHGVNCIFYDDDNLESLLEFYLTHDALRERIAESGRQHAQRFTLERFWQQARDVLAAEWPTIQTRHRLLEPLSKPQEYSLRIWQALGAADSGDPTLLDDLENASEESLPASLLCGQAILEAMRSRDSQGRYAEEALRVLAAKLHRLLSNEPQHVMAALNLVETLLALGQAELAGSGAERLLEQLQRRPLTPDEGDTPRFPPGYDSFRVGWEEAAWKHVAFPSREAQVKQTLLRRRLHELLAEQTGELRHYYEAALACPDQASSRAALGCALARAHHLAEAIPHLRAAVTRNPLDSRAARALYQALLDHGAHEQATALAHQRQRLRLALGSLLPREDWAIVLQETNEPACRSMEPRLRLRLEGPFLALHSLAIVNRQLALGLQRRGYELTIHDLPSLGPSLEPGVERNWIVQNLDRPGSSVGDFRPLATPGSEAQDVCLRLAWPPSWQPPARGYWIVIQPWEYGPIPRDWLAPLSTWVDEVWVPSTFVRDSFVQSGVPADRVFVVPLGVDVERFTPQGEVLPLPTRKTFRFLFVGGTIPRKGIDCLLEAYGQAFTAQDDVTLVIKEMGRGSFYQGQTAEQSLEAFRQNPEHPEIVYLEHNYSSDEMAALYRSCHGLVHPYRGEGFGLPIAEAMACGLPVIVTHHGAALDFVDHQVGWLIPATIVRFAQKRLGELETVDFPRLAEPSTQALCEILRQVHSQPHERSRRGQAGRKRIESAFTWEHTLDVVERRFLSLRDKPIRRPLSQDDGQPHRIPTSNPPLRPWETQVLARLVVPGDVVLQLGADLGERTLLLADRVGPTGSVFVHEPDPHRARPFAAHVRRRGYRNVLQIAEPSSENFSGFPLDVIRLDELVNDATLSLNFVLVHLLDQRTSWLEWLEPLLLRSPKVKLLMTFPPRWDRDRGIDPETFWQRLTSCDVRLFQIVEETSAWQQGLQSLPTLEQFQRLLSRAEKDDRPCTVYGERLVPLRFRTNGPLVSLCLIVKNEEDNVSDCLAGVRDLVDEMIVVDTGSTDRTKELAQAMGARVFDFPWVDSFSAARNACLERATGSWIFWMDADDRLDEENRLKLRQLFASLPAHENVAYSMKCKCLSDSGSGLVTVVDHVRLFRHHEKIRWRYRVHEQILGAVKESGGEVRFADVTILHVGYCDPQLRRRKLERDLRLLELEYRQQPHDPFTLFNLGATYVELGRFSQARPLLEQSLARSNPSDSIVRKLYSLLASCCLHLQDKNEALRYCVEGQTACPDDAELLLREGALRLELGDLNGAKAALVRLLNGETQPHFASIAEGLRGYRGRHQLALVCRQLNEWTEAERLWHQALSEAPDFLPAWVGLAHLQLDQERHEQLNTTLTQLERMPQGECEAALLRGKALFRRREWNLAVQTLKSALDHWPQSVALWEQLSFVLLEQDQAPHAAQEALQTILKLDPENPTAQHNLMVLLRRIQGADAVFSQHHEQE